ncbi:hypothetical protein AGRO_3331 [Agrobacterium sp. ATCC 31749]|nr:hypothetical protein AGRO_3331 [Agrobacterium sp. ATCC 31749]
MVLLAIWRYAINAHFAGQCHRFVDRTLAEKRPGFHRAVS